jgi:exopolysaccharide biosynthesis polyprenyl glycosylphosphotransferase
MESFGYSQYQKVKRLFDVSLSLFILLISFPLLVLCALLIKLDSKGPVFFKQERLGLDQKPFDLIKLRTMIKDAEEKTGPKWAEPKDPRITRVGKFLRKTRLDEIPQFINILKGEMSFIGPRPIRKIFEDQFSLKVPYYFLRHSVKPGLTGWAQVKHDAPRSDEGPVERLQYDLFYIQKASIFLDFLIFLKTIQIVLFKFGQ